MQNQHGKDLDLYKLEVDTPKVGVEEEEKEYRINIIRKQDNKCLVPGCSGG